MVDLVIGGAGFIGAQVSKLLVEAGETVVVFDNMKLDHTDRLAEDLDVEMIHGDVRSYEDLAVAFVKWCPDRVFNFAACTNIPLSDADPGPDLDTTIKGFVNVLEACRKVTPIYGKIKKVVFASTCGVYGGDDEIPVPTPESYRDYRPTSIYHTSKLAAELFLDFYRRVHGIPTIGVRFGKVYGPRKQEVVTDFLTAAMEGRTATVHKDGSSTRDYLYVEDAARAFLCAANSQHSGLYNVGTGVENSVMDLLRVVEKVTGKTVNFVSKDIGCHQHRMCLDPTRAKQDLGFEAKVSLEEGTRRVYEWLLKDRASARPSRLFRRGYLVR